MSTMLYKVAAAIAAVDLVREAPDDPTFDFCALTEEVADVYYDIARAAIEAMMEPTEEQLDAVRHLVQWHTFGRPTEVALVRHCSALRKEPPEGCGSVDHVPPTNMVSYWIFQGIIQAALKDPE